MVANQATGGGINGGSFRGGTATNLAYASQLANYVASMKSQGITLYAISIQNEPDANVTTYEACQWTNTFIHDFVTNLYNVLVAKGVGSTKIILPESQNWQDPHNLAGPAMTDPNTAADVGIVADHNYDGANGPANLTKTNYGKALWETEVSQLSGESSDIVNGVYYAERIFLFMTVAQANAWHYWWLVPYGSDTGLMDTNAAPTKRLFAVGNYSRFVRPGDYRIDVTNNNPLTAISAYKDTNSGNFAIVAINPGSTVRDANFQSGQFHRQFGNAMDYFEQSFPGQPNGGECDEWLFHLLAAAPECGDVCGSGLRGTFQHQHFQRFIQSGHTRLRSLLECYCRCNLFGVQDQCSGRFDVQLAGNGDGLSRWRSVGRAAFIHGCNGHRQPRLLPREQSVIWLTRRCLDWRQRLSMPLLLGAFLPIIRAERHGGQAGSVVERGQRIGLPGITGRHRLGHLGRRNHDRITVNPGVGPVPLVVLSGDGEFAQLVALHDQSTIGMGEIKFQCTGQVFHRSIGRTSIWNFFAIGSGQRTIGQAIAHGDFVFWMNVVSIAGVHRDGEAAIRDILGGQSLCFTQLSPAIGARLAATFHEGGQANNIKREIALAKPVRQLSIMAGSNVRYR